MTAIMRRELSAYFYSPIGYIYLSVFYVFSGFYFTMASLWSNTAEMGGVFASLLTILLFLIPILTMRLLSEDKKNKTDQALLTAPITLTGLVLGKFLAAFLVFALGISIMLVYALIIAVWASPNWPQVLANMLALLFVGAALIAIGMFISSLTENQVIAATGGFGVGLGLLLIDGVSGLVQNPVLSKLITSISFFTRYSSFTSGLFDFSNVLYFFSVCALFLFFTVRALEKRRWS